MSEGFQEKFIGKLEEQYGPWEKSTARFGTASYGKISKDLCISPSQFTKLIYGSATEGMYVRAIRNIDRLSREEEAVLQRDEAAAKWAREREEVEKLQSRQRKARANLILFSLLALAAGAAGAYFLAGVLLNPRDAEPEPGYHPLSLYFDQGFDADFDSPYLKESEVQAYCPCSAYEGEWSLHRPFKLPLPGSRQPGLYYIAKTSDTRMKCSNIYAPFVGKGKALVGYEYLISEIWVDTEQVPLIPKYFNPETKTYTPEFEALNFEDHPQFRRVAVLHAFNVNNFEIRPDSIVRRAELTGRFASNVDEELARDYEIDLRHILRNVLGNLTKTDCDPSPNLFCDPNDLREKESIIAFDCLYTIRTENLGIGGGYPYTKAFRLEKQNYSDNLTCDCEDLDPAGDTEAMKQ